MNIPQNFQKLSMKQGKEFEAAVYFFLRAFGWEILDTCRKVAPLAEVDIVARDPNGKEWWIECKGSYGNSPGCRRPDTVKKACYVASRIARLPSEERRPYMLVTSHLPRTGTESAAALAEAEAAGLFQRIVGFNELSDLFSMGTIPDTEEAEDDE